VEPLGVDGLEAGPLSPELPVGNNRWGDGDTQLLFVSDDASGIVGSEDGRGNTSEPSDEVVVILTGFGAPKEAFRRKLIGDDVEDQVADVGSVTNRSLEETVLGLIGGLVFVDLEDITVGGDLLVVEGLEFCSFGSGVDALESSLA